jgi:hypothetical protein
MDGLVNDLLEVERRDAMAERRVELQPARVHQFEADGDDAQAQRARDLLVVFVRTCRHQKPPAKAVKGPPAEWRRLVLPGRSASNAQGAR